MIKQETAIALHNKFRFNLTSGGAHFDTWVAAAVLNNNMIIVLTGENNLYKTATLIYGASSHKQEELTQNKAEYLLNANNIT